MNRLFDWILSRNTAGRTGAAVSVARLIMRVGVGFMMAFGHGFGKLGRLGADPIKFADPYGFGQVPSLVLAVFAEFFCSLALALGLFTRAAVIPLLITMLTAALIVHGGDPFGRKELALLYIVPLIAILVAGPGRYSLDALFGRKGSSLESVAETQ